MASTIDFARCCAADHVHDGRPAHHLGIARLCWVAKAIERIGDHAKNVAEHVIFISQGWDARHRSLEDIERAVAARMTAASILVIEDEPAIQELVALHLHNAGLHGAARRFGRCRA